MIFIFQYLRFESSCSYDSVLPLIIVSASIKGAISSPKFQDNPSEKDINQGTLVVFNLDASVSNDDLRQIFGAYGEVKEVQVSNFIVNFEHVNFNYINTFALF